MSNTKTYRIFAFSECVSPLTHMARAAGNEAIVMREPIRCERGIVWIPAISGNAIRHRSIREPGWRWLIQRWGLAGKLTLPQLNYCLHGGNLTEGGGRENTARIVAMQQLFPLSRLVGGCLPDQVLGGSLDVWRGRLVCEENRDGLQADLPDGWEMPKEPLRNAEHFVSGYQYTRSDAIKSAPDLLPKEESNGQGRGANADGKSQLMIFAGQAILPGACFTHGFILKNVSALELGALLWSLHLWQAKGGTLGGQASRGHGRLQTSLYFDDDGESAIDAYLEHCDAVKDNAIKWLDDVFAKREEKPKKGKKKEEVPA